jgi:hypothetical protein
VSGKAWLALLCLLAGVALASYGLAYGALLLALAGLALVMTFVYFAYAWVAAWSMKDQPLDNPRQDTQS